MKCVIIDVREPEEFAGGHVIDAINIPLGQLNGGPEKIKELPKGTNIILYCNSGNRSGVAKNILKSFGYLNTVNGISKKHVETHLLK